MPLARHPDFRVSLSTEPHVNRRENHVLIPGNCLVPLIPHRAEAILSRCAAELGLGTPNARWYHPGEGMR